MNDFTFYFKLGWSHIISREAIDHLLFIVALSAVYLIKNWKQVLILVTAFTIGHSITLLLSTYDIIRFNSNWVEFLIPITIVITAGLNFIDAGKKQKQLQYNYAPALFFGLIHGMGFANSIRFMIADSQSIAIPLLGFNLGLEAGQIIVVLLLLFIAFLMVSCLKLPQKRWIYVLSGLSFFVGTIMAIQRWPF